MKFIVEVDSNFDIDVNAFIEIINEQVLTDSDFIMGMSVSRACYGDEVVQINLVGGEK